MSLPVSVKSPMDETIKKINAEEISNLTSPATIKKVLIRKIVTKYSALVVMFQGERLTWKGGLEKMVAKDLQATSPHSSGTSKNESGGSSKHKKLTTKRYGKISAKIGTTNKFTIAFNRFKVDEKLARKGKMAS